MQSHAMLRRSRSDQTARRARYRRCCCVALVCLAQCAPRAPTAAAPHVVAPDATAHARRLATLQTGAEPLVCDLVLEDFRAAPEGRFPELWHPRDAADLDALREAPHYIVETSGSSKVLHGVYRERTITIGRKVAGWDLERYPVLQWRWRAVHLPEGANETIPAKNDTAAAVYAIWEIGFPLYLRGIKYAWSSELPPGTRHHKRLNHDQLLVLQSGKAHLGQWRTESVNVLEHYQSFFQRDDVHAPDAIAVMTDADSTGSRAEAYFADFKLCRPGP